MQKKSIIVPILLLFFSLLIFALNNSAPIKFAEGMAQSLFAAPKAYIYRLKTGKNSEEAKEIQKIKEENAKLISKVIDYERLRRDNEALRSQFETAETQSYKVLPSRVIGFLGNFSQPTTLIIDKGSKNGVKEGMAAVFKNSLVGKTGRVKTFYSQILLLHNSSFSTLAKSASQNSQGILKGQNDFILFDHVSINEKINQGDIILTKGEVNKDGFGIPQDLTIGRVLSVNRNEAFPFQTAKIQSMIDFSQIESLFVILGLE